MRYRKDKRAKKERIKDNRSLKDNKSLKKEIIEEELLVEFSDVFFWWI